MLPGHKAPPLPLHTLPVCPSIHPSIHPSFNPCSPLPTLVSTCFLWGLDPTPVPEPGPKTAGRERGSTAAGRLQPVVLLSWGRDPCPELPCSPGLGRPQSRCLLSQAAKGETKTSGAAPVSVEGE